MELQHRSLGLSFCGPDTKLSTCNLQGFESHHQPVSVNSTVDLPLPRGKPCRDNSLLCSPSSRWGQMNLKGEP